MVGVFSLKFELTEFLMNYGGHIGFDRILCICDNDNNVSEQVILKNGRFENEINDPDEEVTVKRFWIQL